MKQIHVDIFNPESIESAIKELEDFKKRIDSSTEMIIDEMLIEGSHIATERFAQAPYAGVNDVHVSMEKTDNGKKGRLSAEGFATLFIEFGTGINRASALYEEANILNGYVMPHGTFGQGRGSSEFGWYYKGSVGNTPPAGTRESSKKPGLVHTYGNDASSCMWFTKRDLEDDFPNIVRRIVDDR